jgi:hypothetical protein
MLLCSTVAKTWEFCVTDRIVMMGLYTTFIHEASGLLYCSSSELFLVRFENYSAEVHISQFTTAG